MTKSLQILFILTLGLVLFFWCSDLFLGSPVHISDKSVIEGWAEDKAMYESELMKSRLWTLVYAIPTIILLVATIKSLKYKNELMFYWTFFIGLTILQILPIAGLLSDKANDPPLIIPLMLTCFAVFISGQLFSIFKIIKLTKSAN